MTPLEEKLYNEIVNSPWYQEKYRLEITSMMARMYFLGKKDVMDEMDSERKRLEGTKSLVNVFMELLEQGKMGKNVAK